MPGVPIPASDTPKPDTAAQAAPPAPHQIEAYNAEKVAARITSTIGLLVTTLGAIMPLLSGWLGPNSGTVIIVGAIITAAGTVQRSLAHSAFQKATDN